MGSMRENPPVAESRVAAMSSMCRPSSTTWSRDFSSNEPSTRLMYSKMPLIRSLPEPVAAYSAFSNFAPAPSKK